MTWCNCVCEEAEENNGRFIEDVKNEIAKQLGLSVDDGQNEHVE